MAKSLINDENPMFRRSSCSTLSRVRLFSLFGVMHDRTWLFIRFSLENDRSPEQFEIITIPKMIRIQRTDKLCFIYN